MIRKAISRIGAREISSDICPFCSRPDIGERTIAQNAFAFAFPTHTPVVPGHTLVCPRRHVRTLDDLDDDEILAILELKREISFALRKVFGAAGFNCAWNEGDIAGQTVPHMHLHVLPRTVADAGVYEYEPRKFLYRPGSRAESPLQELVQVASDIRAALSQSGHSRRIDERRVN